MVLEISVKDEKAELFLQLIQELTNSMVEKFHIVSCDNKQKLKFEAFFDENEILNRIREVKENRVKTLSREEVFDGIC